MVTELYENNIFNVGKEYTFNITLTEKNNVLSSDSKITFALSLGVSLSSVLLSDGSLSGNIWTIGDIQGSNVTGRFKVTVVNSDITSIVVGATASTSETEINLGNNLGSWTWTGISQEEFESSENKETHNSIYYVSELGGDDSSAIKGDGHRASSSIENPLSSSDFIEGDVVKVLPGTYTVSDNLGIVDSKITYDLEKGATVILDNSSSEDMKGGVGNILEGDYTGTEVNILGNGKFEGTGNSGIAVMMGVGNKAVFNLEADEIIAHGADYWAITNQAQNSNIKVKRIITDAIAYSSRTQGDIDGHDRYFQADYIECEIGDRDGLIRYQMTPGVTNSNDVYKIGSIKHYGTSELTNSIVLQGGGWTNSKMSMDVENLENLITGYTPVTIYTGTSNDSKNVITYAGGSGDDRIDCMYNLHFKNVYSDAINLGINGFYFDGKSRAFTRIDNGISLNQPNIAVFDPHINDDSEVIVEGNYFTNSNYPNIMLNQAKIADNGVLIFRNCRLVNPTANPNVTIATGIDNPQKVIFENCTFINDGTVPNIATNSGSAIDVQFKNCWRNNTTALVNVNDILSGLTSNINVK